MREVKQNTSDQIVKDKDENTETRFLGLTVAQCIIMKCDMSYRTFVVIRKRTYIFATLAMEVFCVKGPKKSKWRVAFAASPKDLYNMPFTLINGRCFRVVWQHRRRGELCFLRYLCPYENRRKSINGDGYETLYSQKQ